MAKGRSVRANVELDPRDPSVTVYRLLDRKGNVVMTGRWRKH
jgi:hypothetical protein